MRHARVAAWVLSAVGVLAGGTLARADETTFCDRFIDVVPATITRPGHYCLRRSHYTSQQTGALIIIRSNDVWLDLNNFVLDNTAAGPGVAGEGIYSAGHRNITIRNGSLRGFAFGIDLETIGTGSNYTVEDMRLENNTTAAIFMPQYLGTGGGHVVRRNVIRDTGGSTDPAAGPAWGLVLGGGGHVSDNEIINVFGATGGGQGIGIELREGTAVVAGNRISRADAGIGCDFPEKYLRDNVVVVGGTPYGALCTKVGATNHP
jgi:hypothetical protein